MGKNTHLVQDKIAQIIALKESGLQTKDIVAQLGVNECSVRHIGSSISSLELFLRTTSLVQ